MPALVDRAVGCCTRRQRFDSTVGYEFILFHEVPNVATQGIPTYLPANLSANRPTEVSQRA